MSIPSLAFASPVESSKMSQTRTSLSLGRSPSRASKASTMHDVALDGGRQGQEIAAPLPVLTKARVSKDGVELGELRREGSKTEGGGELRQSTSPSGSATGDLPAQQLDHRGRRPLALGTKEEKWVLAALFFTLFTAGWNDSSIGPLLLRIQGHYNVSFTIVSLTFVFNFIGFLTAACANVWLSDHLGFGKTITLGAVFQIVAYVLQCWAPPFPLFCFSFVLNGIGMGLQDAQANAFVARLPNMMVKMSILHAVYGLGAMVCPLISTQFSKMDAWYHHYLVSLAVAIINITFLGTVIRLRTETSLLGSHPDEVLTSSEGGEPTATNDSGAKMLDILKSKTVGLFALFTLFYVGLEVTLGGWMPTYLILVRGGTANSGYISTGFFAGLTLGRLVFIDLNRRLGERRAVYVYTIVALGLEFIVWFVPSLIGSAVAVSFVGLLLGPMYVLIMGVVAKILPRHLQSGAIGFIACFGQGGSAFFPFLTGLLAEHYGVKVMPPVVVGMLVGCYGLWFLTPKVPRRDE